MSISSLMLSMFLLLSMSTLLLLLLLLSSVVRLKSDEDLGGVAVFSELPGDASNFEFDLDIRRTCAILLLGDTVDLSDNVGVGVDVNVCVIAGRTARVLVCCCRWLPIFPIAGVSERIGVARENKAISFMIELN